MNINTAIGWKFEYLRRQYLPVGDNNNQIGIYSPKVLREIKGPHFLRVQDMNPLA